MPWFPDSSHTEALCVYDEACLGEVVQNGVELHDQLSRDLLGEQEKPHSIAEQLHVFAEQVRRVLEAQRRFPIDVMQDRSVDVQHELHGTLLESRHVLRSGRKGIPIFVTSAHLLGQIQPSVSVQAGS